MKLNQIFKKNKILRFARELIIFLVIIAGIQTYQSWGMLDTGEESSPPTFSLSDIQNNIFDLENVRGKKILIYFFAPWCSVCKLSADNLSKLVTSLNPEEYAIITIALSYNNESEVKDFAEKYKLPAPVLLGNDEIMDAFKINAFPSYYIVNKNFKISSRQVGFSSYWGLKLRLLYY